MYKKRRHEWTCRLFSARFCLAAYLLSISFKIYFRLIVKIAISPLQPHYKRVTGYTSRKFVPAFPLIDQIEQIDPLVNIPFDQSSKA